MPQTSALVIEKITFDWSGVFENVLYMLCVIGDKKVNFIFSTKAIDDYILSSEQKSLMRSSWQKAVAKKIKNLVNSDKEFQEVLLRKFAENLKGPDFEPEEWIEIRLEGPNIFKDYRVTSDFPTNG